jgi:hypothetical protein
LKAEKDKRKEEKLMKVDIIMTYKNKFRKEKLSKPKLIWKGWQLSKRKEKKLPKKKKNKGLKKKNRHNRH